MRRKDVDKIASEFGLDVENGGKHYRLTDPDTGRLVAVAAHGNQREKGPFTPQEYLRRTIRQALRGQR